MFYRLIALNSDEAGQRWSVSSTPLVVGRDASCEVRLSDPEVAARHAEVWLDSDALRIRDLGSMNRILVNRHEVREARLKHGDTIEIGLTRLMVEAQVQADVSAEAMPSPHARRRVPKVAVVAVALMGVVWLIAARRERDRSRPSARGAPRPPVVETPATPATGTSASPSAAAPTTVSSAEMGQVSPTATGTAPAVETESAPRPSAPSLPSPPRADRPAEVLGAPPDLTPISEEVRRLREDVALLREAVVERALPTPPVQPSPPPVPEEELLVRARAAEAEGRFAEADQLLVAALSLAPGRRETLADRARLLERRGLLKRAARLWAELADAAETPETLRSQARTELRRLQASEATLQAVEAPIRLAEVTAVKFPTPEDADELRAVHVRIERQPEAPPPDSDAITVEVVFYDREPDESVVHPSVVVSPQLLALDGPWEDGEPRTLVAAYRVPRGQRGKAEYHGFIARLNWYGRVVAQQARPRSLLETAMTPLGGGQAENRP